ncbi:hypothetical protein EC973_009207 [Apophysomyces ossiformis]|uniref:UBX domain-containing protein n=1 Tax=Apophysomyces ossiformis TaxID=679940 RepID=A0A8H7BRD5_9FUNG|nr:hypothetical protein EC973_009207 [Apophysomyces ossiformis]
MLGTIKDFGTHEITKQDIIEKLNALNPDAMSANVSAATQPQEQPSGSNQGKSSDDSEDKLKKEKIKKQLEEAKKQRQEKERQEIREREIKRREEGKELQKAQQSIEDRQNKLYFAKLKKEKREDEEHRQKIREQIARDREEQMAERQRKKADANSTERSSSNPTPKTVRHHDESHLSIRQLDGSTMRRKFEATDKLAAVKRWIDQNRTDGDQPYKLLSQFPTRQFSIGDEEKTLRELDLCPSGTIIMKIVKNVSHAYSTNDGYGMVDYAYSAGGLVYNTVSSVGSTLFGIVSSFLPGEGNTTNQTPQDEGGQRLGRAPSTSTRGNVNTFRSSESDADKDYRGTYNGNSTNQE